MPSTPTTKSQVQAYQFVLRRMQSALVRRDAVMLHDPMRTHSRATIVGVVLGAIGLVGFVIWGLLSPQPTVPGAGSIVIGEQSGAIFVVAGDNPKKLIPTFNLASARLLLMAQQKQGQQGDAGASGSAAPAAPTDVKAPTVVADDQLKDIPRGRLQGIVDGPGLLPSKEQRISDNWAVCDKIGLDRTLNDPTSIGKNETTVLAGVKDMGQELGQNESIQVEAEDGKTYLIYRLQSSPNQPNANAVRAEVDVSNSAVTSALKMQAKGRKVSMGLLNAIPPVGRLTAPQVDGVGSAPQGYTLNNLKVGDVFMTQPVDVPVYYVLLKNGIQEVSPAVASILRSVNSPVGAPLIQLPPDQIPSVSKITTGMPGYLPVDDYPRTETTVLDPTVKPVSCLGWSLTGEGPSQDAHTAVYVGSVVPVPGQKDPQGATQAMDIGQKSPDGLKIDKFYMQPGFAAVVRSATGKDSFDKGPIQLISDRGLRYGVPDVATAQGLGLDNQRPAPDVIINLLPVGALLDTQSVQKTYDSTPVDPNAGSYPTQSAQPQASGN